MKQLVVAAVVAAVVSGGSPTEKGAAIRLDVTPLDLGAGRLDGVSLAGAWRLDAGHEEFGGISGLLVEGETVTAVTDRGWWITGERDGLTLATPITMKRMRGAVGKGFTKAAGDAESLTRRDGRLVVGFERDHRIAAHTGGGKVGRELRARGFEALPGNGGLEALATLPDGRLIAIGEEPDERGFPVFVHEPGKGVIEGRLPAPSHHNVTGADIGPDGRLYVLQRYFSVFTGVSIRVLRYGLGEDGLPDAGTMEVLAEWDSVSGIDNMEGIAAFRDGADGPLVLWLVSDDNFNAIQRTILVALEVAE